MIAAIIIGVLVVVGGGVTAAILLLGGDDDDSGGGGDSAALAAAQAYVDALRDGDCDAAKEVSTENLLGSIDCEQELVPPEGIEVEIGDPEIVDESETDATAKTEVTLTSDGESNTTDYTIGLVNQDGEWLVDSLTSGDAPTDGPTSAPTSVPSFSVPTSIPSFSIPSFSIPSFSIPSFSIPTG